MVKAKRDRIDGTAGAVQVMAAAARQIVPPLHVPLRGDDLVFFDSVVKEFARSEWSDHQLELAAILAKKMRMLRDNITLLDEQGMTGLTANGTACQNPLLGGVRMLDTSIMATRRTLSLHARAQGGEGRDIGKRRELAKGIEGNNPLDDDLLARPN